MESEIGPHAGDSYLPIVARPLNRPPSRLIVVGTMPRGALGWQNIERSECRAETPDSQVVQ
jgi:hypothetical protein